MPMIVILIGIIATITGIFGPRKLLFISMFSGFLFGIFSGILAGDGSSNNILFIMGFGVFFLFFFGVSGFITRYYASGTTSIKTYFKDFLRD